MKKVTPCKEFIAHVDRCLNPRVAGRNLDDDYNSPERIKKREKERIYRTKFRNENSIENLKTKKRHL